MAEKRILIADADVKAWDELRRALGESWAVIGATTCGGAQTEVDKGPFNVVIANYDLLEKGGGELLNHIRVSHPRIIRFVAVAQAMKEMGVCDLGGGHQMLAVPFDPAAVKSAIERALDANYGMSGSMRELVGRVRAFPAIPSLYLEVVKALKNPDASTADIGAIIAKDMAMTTKLVQVLNSAYYGLPRTIIDPTEAVGILGFETVKSLILTIKLLSEYDNVKPVYFSIDSIWRHSTNVARTARILSLLETGDTEYSSTAYTAGLMHDLGKVILAANFDTQYHGAHALARKQHIPLWEVEKEIFGASHGEMGAYLLNLWGLSAEVVQIAALHHHPCRAEDKAFSALTAVHAANALEYEGGAENDGLPVAVVDMAYLQALGLGKRLQIWRVARHEPDWTKFQAPAQSAKPQPKAAAPAPAVKPMPERAVRVEMPPRPFVWQRLWRLMGIGLGVTAALLLLARLEIMRLEHQATKQAVQHAAETPPPAATTETIADVAPVVTPVETMTADTPTNAAILIPPTNAAPVDAAQVRTTNAALPSIGTNAAPTVPAQARTTNTALQNIGTNARPVIAAQARTTNTAPVKTGLDHLKLDAIIFSTQNPIALINGKPTSLGQVVADCRIVNISPSTVTLEYQHQQRTLTMK